MEVKVTLREQREMSTIVANGLIDKLKDIQVKEGLSDHKFAAKLGISYQLWQMTRTGSRDIGLSLVRATVKAYPELYRDVLFFLGADVVNISQLVEDTTTPSDTSQNRPRAVFRVILDQCHRAFNLLRKRGRKAR